MLVHVIEKVGQLASDDVRVLKFRCEVPSGLAPAAESAASPVAMAMPVPPRQLDLSGDTNFEIGRATLTSAATGRLDDLLVASKDTVFRNVIIEGYTDSSGSSKLNQKLSKGRADNVEQYLRSHGLRSDNYIARGEGSANPIASNSTATRRARNRRVEIHLTQ